MIITAPTGLYKSILPQNPSDAGNFTFTISDQPPPRSGESFVQLPLPEIGKQLPDRVFTKLQKRVFYGELVYDITVSGPGTTGNGTSQFEVGQVLNFVDQEEELVDPFELDSIELRQDLKVVDFEAAGLNEEDYAELRLASEKRLEELTLEIAIVSTELKSNADSIQSNQANTNNSASLLANIVIVLGDDSSQANKVKDNIESLQEEKDELLSSRDESQSSLSDLRDELQRVREVVR